MFLTIPVANLVDSDIDIWIDPQSGDFTYNIKDTLAPLQHGYSVENLILTLQTSSEGSSMCLRVWTKPVVDQTLPSTDSQALGSAFSPLVFPVHSHYHTRSAEMPAQSIPDLHDRGPCIHPSEQKSVVDVLNAPYRRFLDSDKRKPLGQTIQIHPASSLVEKNTEPPQSPISETLSSIVPCSIIEADSPAYHSGDFISGGHYEFQCNDYIYGSDGTRSYQSEFTSNMIGGQDHPASDGSSGASASCTETVFFSGSNACATQIIETAAATNGDNHNRELFDQGALPTATPSIPDHYHSDLHSQHQYQHCQEKAKHEGYPCPYATCHRVLKSLYTQQLHMKTHIAKPRKHFACTMGCPESFTRHHDRLRHEVSQHGKQCEFLCRVCDRFFSSQRMLDRHTCWGSRVGPLKWQLKDCNESNDFRTEA